MGRCRGVDTLGGGPRFPGGRRQSAAACLHDCEVCPTRNCRTRGQVTARPQAVAERTFTADDLEGFSVGDDGVTFTFDYGFPHVVKALEPDGKYFMTWNELRPFIKRGGLLGRFVS